MGPFVIYKKVLILYLCFLSVVFLLAFAFSQGFISPCGLGIALLIAIVGVATWSVIAIEKPVREFEVHDAPSRPFSLGARKRRLGIWASRIAIIILLLLFIHGFASAGSSLGSTRGSCIQPMRHRGNTYPSAIHRNAH